MMDAALIQELRAKVIEAFVSLPKRGLEIGGVLYGEPNRIFGFEEIPCEHRYGPSYALSRADYDSLGQFVEEHKQSDGPPITGFFRSFTSREPAIEAADEEFIGKHFPHDEFVFLMLQPISVERCDAAIRLFRDGMLVPEDEPEVFPFDAAAFQAVEPQPPPNAPPAAPHEPLPGPEPDQPEPPEEPAPVMMPPAYAPPRLPPPTYRRQQEVPTWTTETVPRHGRRQWWLVAACLLSAVCGAVVYDLWMLANEPHWADLHLDAVEAGPGLRLTWDANAVRNTGAARALLAVSDGAAHREIPLNAAQLRGGSYDYTPEHADVAFRLILYAKGLGVSGDAVRVASLRGVERPAVLASSVAGSADRQTTVPPSPVSSPSPDRAAVAVPPTTVHEVQPRVPEGIRSRIQGEIVIPVKLQVTERGRVARASAEESSLDGLHRYLADLAEKAAREWRFTPAKSRQGVAVASSKTVHFIFTP